MDQPCTAGRKEKGTSYFDTIGERAQYAELVSDSRRVDFVDEHYCFAGSYRNWRIEAKRRLMVYRVEMDCQAAIEKAGAE